MSFSKLQSSSLSLIHEEIWTPSEFFTQVFIRKLCNCLWRKISYSQKHVEYRHTEFSSLVAGDINPRWWLLDSVAQMVVGVHWFRKLFRITLPITVKCVDYPWNRVLLPSISMFDFSIDQSLVPSLSIWARWIGQNPCCDDFRAAHVVAFSS